MHIFREILAQENLGAHNFLQGKLHFGINFRIISILRNDNFPYSERINFPFKIIFHLSFIPI